MGEHFYNKNDRRLVVAVRSGLVHPLAASEGPVKLDKAGPKSTQEDPLRAPRFGRLGDEDSPALGCLQSPGLRSAL